MPLFRIKKKLPEVNYFKGGAAWTNYGWTLDIDTLFPPGSPPKIVPIVSLSKIFSYGYNDSIERYKPYKFILTGENATLKVGSASGITDIDGGIELQIEVTAPTTITLTFQNCFVNKVFTVTITA